MFATSTSVPVDFSKAEHKSAAYTENQPFGQVPFIVRPPSALHVPPPETDDAPGTQDDDGFVLFESRAIGRYLAAQGSGPELVPTEPRARALFEQAASIEQNDFEPYASGILAERYFKPMYVVFLRFKIGMIIALGP